MTLSNCNQYTLPPTSPPFLTIPIAVLEISARARSLGIPRQEKCRKPRTSAEKSRTLLTLAAECTVQCFKMNREPSRCSFHGGFGYFRDDALPRKLQDIDFDGHGPSQNWFIKRDLSSMIQQVHMLHPSIVVTEHSTLPGPSFRTPYASVGYQTEKKYSAFTWGRFTVSFFVRGYTDGSVVKFDFRNFSTPTIKQHVLFDKSVIYCEKLLAGGILTYADATLLFMDDDIQQLEMTR
ncbi:hypothetical protein C8J56DRAFT_890641 [Mycena floridula]|nr:hypothetical protein C8J56DRAFT_890641 [Mycena floridula]